MNVSRTDCGPGTIKRCKRAMDLVLMGDDRPHHYVIYLGAGVKRSHFPLKQMMLTFLVSFLQKRGYQKAKSVPDAIELSNGITQVTIVQSKKQAWGTFRETQSVVAELKERNQSGDIWVVSTEFHKARILLIWWFFKGFHAKPFMVPEPITWFQRILEWVKIIKVIGLGIFMKLKPAG